MKRIFPGIVSCLLLQTVLAQKTEFSVGVNGTVSFFRGANAASVSTFYLTDAPSIPNITGRYYGKKAGLEYNVEATMQRISKKGLLAGVSAGYERLTSKVKITEATQWFTARADGITMLTHTADGTTRLTHTFINLFPFVGKRFCNSMNFSLDIDLGMDIAIPLSAYEEGEAQVSDGSIATTDLPRKKVVDLRPRLQLRWQKNQVGVQTSFSLGLTNYYGQLTGADPEAYANVARFGIFYKL